jgi:cytochrome b561
MNDWHPFAKALHWTMAAMLAATGCLGFLMVRAADEAARTGDYSVGPAGLAVFDAYQLHKSLGVLLLGLAAVRLVWRLVQPRPPVPATTGITVRRAASAVHGVLYLLMVALPVSGWLVASASPLDIPTMVFGLGPLPDPVRGDALTEARFGLLHRAAAAALAGLVALHVGAALKHHFIDRDGVLAAMLPRKFSRSSRRKVP